MVPRSKDRNGGWRGGVRFPVDLAVHFTSEHHGRLETVSGRTLEMSSSELSFIAERRPEIGQALQVSIDWPVQLDGGVKLQLIIFGVVVQTQETKVVLKIEKHDFRTRCVRLPSTAHPGWLG